VGQRRAAGRLSAAGGAGGVGGHTEDRDLCRLHSDYRIANREVVRIVRANPARFYGFVFVHADLLQQAVQRAGAYKILFGSDGPWLHPALELEKIRMLGLSRAEEGLIMGQNLLRLIAGVRGAAHTARDALMSPGSAPPGAARRGAFAARGR
jgi:hypothetical protein